MMLRDNLNVQGDYAPFKPPGTTRVIANAVWRLSGTPIEYGYFFLFASISPHAGLLLVAIETLYQINWVVSGHLQGRAEGSVGAVGRKSFDKEASLVSLESSWLIIVPV